MSRPINIGELPSAPPATHDMGLTGNALLLLGYALGAITKEPEGYEVIGWDAVNGTGVLRRVGTTHTYRIAITQIAGEH